MLFVLRPTIALAAVMAGVVGSLPAAASSGLGATEVPERSLALEDDTGLLTVSVPAGWSDTDTAPTVADDGTELPSVTAAIDLDAFAASVDEPGVAITAVPYTTDTWGAAAEAVTSGCRIADDSRYDDGAFVGVMRHWTDCGFGEDRDAEVFIVVASPVNRSMTLQVLIQIPGPEERDIAEGILSSFNLTHLPDPPPTTTPSSPTTAAPTTASPTTSTTTTSPTTAAPITASPATTSATTTAVTATTAGASTTVAGPPATSDEPVHLSDDSGALQIDVPATWSDVFLGPATRNDGVELPNIMASTDLDAFLPSDLDDDEFLTPGVVYRGLPYTADTEAEVNGVGRLGCVEGGVTPYSDGLFTGHMRVFPSCAGTDTRQFVIVANPADMSFTALLVIRVTEPGSTELDIVLDSFNYVPSVITTSPIATT